MHIFSYTFTRTLLLWLHYHFVWTNAFCHCYPSYGVQNKHINLCALCNLISFKEFVKLKMLNQYLLVFWSFEVSWIHYVRISLDTIIRHLLLLSIVERHLPVRLHINRGLISLNHIRSLLSYLCWVRVVITSQHTAPVIVKMWHIGLDNRSDTEDLLHVLCDQDTHSAKFLYFINSYFCNNPVYNPNILLGHCRHCS